MKPSSSSTFCRRAIAVLESPTRSASSTWLARALIVRRESPHQCYQASLVLFPARIVRIMPASGKILDSCIKIARIQTCI